jgi:hypothetical protein
LRYLSISGAITESKNHQKVVTRHIWQGNVEEVDHLRHQKEVKEIYAKHKETMERVFADAKRKAWDALDHPKRTEKIVHAGDAYFCCLKSKAL